MHDLKTNFDKILPIVKQTLADQLDSCGNLHAYPNKPDLPDTHIITLSLLQEALSIDSEHWYWSKLQTDLKELRHSGLQDCLVLADKGYLSAQGQLDLFCQTGIEVQTPMRRNQMGYRRWPSIFKKSRRRIETVFSQLSDQMMLKRNYTKSFNGLRARIIAKVASVTFLQYLNKQNNRPLNHIKHALAA